MMLGWLVVLIIFCIMVGPIFLLTVLAEEKDSIMQYAIPGGILAIIVWLGYKVSQC
jgi:hypothetical protein